MLQQFGNDQRYICGKKWEHDSKKVFLEKKNSNNKNQSQGYTLKPTTATAVCSKKNKVKKEELREVFRVNE
jgi:hypothetical protein